MGKDKNEYWWNPKRPRSYNCLFNFIVGARGSGKTYGMLKDMVQRFLNSPRDNRAQFVYMRRTKTELRPLTTANGARIFDDIAKEFPHHELKAVSDILQIRPITEDGSEAEWETCGYGFALSTSTTKKSIAYPQVRDIVFDEFIIDNTRTYHYLADEVRKFLDAYETIARPGNDPNRPITRVWFIANAVTVNNPYFAFFHLDMPYNGDIQRFGKTKDVLVQNVHNTMLSEVKKRTRFGRMISGSKYSEYAYDNEWLQDDERFIATKTQRAKYYMSLRYMDTWLGIWYDELQWVYYVSADVDLQYPVKYSATTDDHMPNTILFKQLRSQSYIARLLEAYNYGAVRYESVKLKGMFREILGMGYGG